MSDANAAVQELEQTVDMLEQILEVMPDDLFTLRALYETFLKLQSPEKAFDALARLDDAARASQSTEIMRFVIEQYRTIVDDAPQVLCRIERLEELLNVSDLLNDVDVAPLPETGGEPEVSKPKGIDSEMALAWELLQDGQLSEDEYSDVLHDLTEMSSRELGVPVTVLHILNDRNFSRFERLLSHLCQKTETPIVSISQFEVRDDLGRLLPLEFMSRNAALPFATVGGDLLLAVLNPIDRELVERAENLCGRRCHPYLVTPAEYDQRLALIKKDAA